MYVSGHVDIFDMVDIDLLTVVCAEHAEFLIMLHREAGFADVVRSGVDIEIQSELLVSEEPDIGRTQKPILVEVSTQEPIMAEEFSVEDVVLEDYVSSGEDVEHYNGEFDESAPSDGQFFFDDEGIDTTYETEYDVQSSEDTGTDDDDDVDGDFLVDKENEIVEPDVDVHLFGISMDLPFDNIGVTNLFLEDVLEGEDVDVINADGFDSDPGNDEETNYKKRRLAKLRTEMEGVMNASGQWKYSFYTSQKFTTPKVAKDRAYLHSIENGRNLKLYKNDGVMIRARCDGKVLISMSKDFRAKAKAERKIRGDHILQYFMLRDYVVELQSTNPNTTIKIAVERNTDPSLPTRVFQRIYGPFLGQVLVAVGLDLNNRIYPLAYALVEAESGWCGQSIQGFVVESASATNVRILKSCRPNKDLLLNNICEVFNGKIIRGRDKPVITLLEIMESIKKEARLMKVQWNGNNKYQVSGSLGDQCIVDVVGRLRMKRKRSKNEDEPFVKYGKLSRKGRTITCQSCKNTGHNKATCKGLGRKETTGGNNAEASGNASRQAQQTKPVVGQDGLGGSGAGVVIGLSASISEGGPGGAGVASQGPSHMSKTRNADGREMGDGVPTQSSRAGGASEWSFL
ncbi:hypothetical protein Tco_1474138 [Tanacetum coccineum]